MTSAATLTAWNMWDSNETGLGDALWPGGGSGGAALTGEENNKAKKMSAMKLPTSALCSGKELSNQTMPASVVTMKLDDNAVCKVIPRSPVNHSQLDLNIA
ncbi:hypothetical protein C0Q70_00784 [Pomacea canaliculata]|uniref:Uncharacterized protein n=1 Tax=Pomacea canaliculata TaxID=400727 RepID=A0A2T7PXM0_POMCA|nr:hypothetical protein C0Q70_00784 [Pomacea canaliculata]